MIPNTPEQLQNMSAGIFPMRSLGPCFCLCLHFVQVIPHPQSDRPHGSCNASGKDQDVFYLLYLEITKPEQGFNDTHTLQLLHHYTTSLHRKASMDLFDPQNYSFEVGAPQKLKWRLAAVVIM